MENASKALLIAGGVLIAILVLTLGVFIARNMADYTSKVYAQLEESERTEFNQQFLNYDKRKDLTSQDVITIINLAKDSNRSNNLTAADAPSDSLNNKSLYVTVKYFGTSVEQKDDEQINKQILQWSMLQLAEYKFSCEVTVNPNTGYVNYIEINY